MVNIRSHHPRKRFGQNFLQDQAIIEHIIDEINPQSTDHLVEIGPGFGALTQKLLPNVQALDVIELDRDLIPYLETLQKKAPTLTIHQADALKFDFKTIGRPDKKLRIVGNLPYNISTPLLFHLFQYSHMIQDMHFMLQKEVVDRLAANVGTSQYGRLTIMAQYFCQIEKCFDVPSTAFNPPPKVTSAIVRLMPHQTLPCLVKDIQKLETVVKTAFSQRRKTLRNTLKKIISAEDLEALGIDSSLRPEQITLEEYVKITGKI